RGIAFDYAYECAQPGIPPLIGPSLELPFASRCLLHLEVGEAGRLLKRSSPFIRESRPLLRRGDKARQDKNRFLALTAVVDVCLIRTHHEQNPSTPNLAGIYGDKRPNMIGRANHGAPPTYLLGSGT